MHTAKAYAMRSAESFAAHVVYKTTTWNKTEKGRAATLRHNATRKERNKLLSAFKSSGIAVFDYAQFDKMAVQAALITWGGI